MRRRNYYIIIGIIIILIGSVLTGVLVPLSNRRDFGSFSGGSLIEGTAATFNITQDVTTNFATYHPINVDYTPSIPYKKIPNNLVGVDLQGRSLTSDLRNLLSEYGFALLEGGKYDLVDYYGVDKGPYFVSTDICLHLFHLMFDFSLKLIEVTSFYDMFNETLYALRSDQITMYNTIGDPKIQYALERNIAYLSVMIYFLADDNSTIPTIGESLTLTEIDNINSLTWTSSAIFQYAEMFELYKVRGHYNDHELLPRYFKAMMYAGRMGFLLQESDSFPGLAINQTRMTLLLLFSFNTSVELSYTVMDYWEMLYDPITFYVGESDDLTPKECLEIYEDIDSPSVTELGNDSLILEYMNEAKKYRKPLINSIFLVDMDDYQNKTQSFRLFGQRFVSDSYIFQELMHPNVIDRGPPIGLDVFSVFGSPRADLHLKSEESYQNYKNQIDKLRNEFGSLNETSWTQNLYWLWLYTLFPLLKPASSGYPSFMQSNAWSDKALMTVMASWAELKHDTILYAKYPSSSWGIPPEYRGYVEPNPEVYARLSSLLQFLIDGLEGSYLSYPSSFHSKLIVLKSIFDRLIEISIKELNNEELSDEDHNFIIGFGSQISNAYLYKYEEMEITKARSAIIADVASANQIVLEVAVGNPYIIYVVVPDHRGKLYLTIGAALSYYEFNHPISDILNDEEWQQMLDTSPPDLPEWIIDNIPIILQSTSTAVMIHIFRRRNCKI